MSSIGVKFNATNLNKTVTNLIRYSNGFLTETKQSKGKIAKHMASNSVEVFYQYLDSVARLHPDMLHHIYEWGNVGSPYQRLVELNISLGKENAMIYADFLESTSIPENGTEPFYNKAEVMESGKSVTVNEKDAQALFFEIDGVEYFRKGPITIQNPGGEAVRGSFVKTFNEFYGSYFSQVYLRSIKFYEHFRNPKPYVRNLRSAVKSGNAAAAGKASAIQWINSIPGDDSYGV